MSRQYLKRFKIEWRLSVFFLPSSWPSISLMTDGGRLNNPDIIFVGTFDLISCFILSSLLSKESSFFDSTISSYDYFICPGQVIFISDLFTVGSYLVSYIKYQAVVIKSSFEALVTYAYAIKLFTRF